ncbi:8-oxo-dGTP diphosphatase [Paenibacillus shirakamiensis]|uniref:8-oxo-dGTP diphosphatase n=1 Tax=Paenibacillus shirakamiensis TaxID=1265935 RepID=A0ABS4JIC7_9BACL|nr:8-oxo-dGTP diphosphatase [Paenibacillus shirakamiensis]
MTHAKNKSLAAAAIREAKEETGLDVTVHGVVAVHECRIESRQAHVLFITFRAEIVGGQQQILHPDEIVEISWVDLEQVGKLMLVPSYENLMENMLKMQREALYMNQGRA